MDDQLRNKTKTEKHFREFVECDLAKVRRSLVLNGMLLLLASTAIPFVQEFLGVSQVVLATRGVDGSLVLLWDTPRLTLVVLLLITLQVICSYLIYLTVLGKAVRACWQHAKEDSDDPEK